MSTETIPFGTDRIAVVGGVLLHFPDLSDVARMDVIHFDTFAEAQEAAAEFGGFAHRVVAL